MESSAEKKEFNGIFFLSWRHFLTSVSARRSRSRKKARNERNMTNIVKCSTLIELVHNIHWIGWFYKMEGECEQLSNYFLKCERSAKVLSYENIHLITGHISMFLRKGRSLCNVQRAKTAG